MSTAIINLPEVNHQLASVNENDTYKESIFKALDTAIFGYFPVAIMLELGSSIGTGANMLFSTSLTTTGKVITTKFVRVLAEQVVSKNCTNTDALNEIQKNIFCINEGTSESVVFRTSVAAIAGFSSSLIFKGYPLFAIYDGLNALLYDGVSELKKVEAVQKNDVLNAAVNFLDTNGALIFEGLEGILKTTSTIDKISSELLENQNTLTGKINILTQNPKGSHKIYKKFVDQLNSEISSLQVQTLELANKIRDAQFTKFHGFISGFLVDNFAAKIKDLVDKVIEPVKTSVGMGLSDAFNNGNSQFTESNSKNSLHKHTTTSTKCYSNYTVEEFKFSENPFDICLLGDEQKVIEEVSLV